MSDSEEIFDFGSAAEEWRKSHAPRTATAAKKKRAAIELGMKAEHASGRTEQINFRARPGFKLAMQRHARRMEFDSLTEFIVAAMEAYVARSGGKP